MAVSVSAVAVVVAAAAVAAVVVPAYPGLLVSVLVLEVHQ